MRTVFIFTLFVLSYLTGAASPTMCDSIVQKDFDGVPISKIVNTFDADGRVIIKTQMNFNNMNKSWVNYEQIRLDYDDFGNISLKESLKWDASAASWKNVSKTEESFNELGSKLSQNVYSWEDNNWVLESATRATYNNFGMELSNIIRYYDSFSQGWKKSKNEYTYNDQNLVISSTYFGIISDDADFVPSFQTIYDYNTSGKMTKRLMQDWDVTTNAYIPSMMDTWEYSEDGSSMVETNFFADFITHKLEPYVRNDNTYDLRGNILCNKFFSYFDGTWSQREQADYSYNDADSLLLVVKSSVMSGAVKLEPVSKQTYTRDDNNMPIVMLMQFMGDDGNWMTSSKDEKTFDADKHMLTQNRYLFQSAWDGTANGEWIETFKGEYRYDNMGQMTFIEELSFDNFSKKWSGLQKSEWLYNDEGNLVQEAKFVWDDAGASFVLAGTINYYYSENTGVSNKLFADDSLKIIYDGNCVFVYRNGIEVEAQLYSPDGRPYGPTGRLTKHATHGIYIVVTKDGKSMKIAL